MDIVDVLHNEYQKRRAKNSRYSLRAFAQQMGVQSATLSAVLKRKRALPAPQTLRLLNQLNLTTHEKKRIFRSLKTPIKDAALKEFWARPAIDLEKATISVVSEWEYAAVFSLCRVSDFKADEKWIAKRLGLDVARAKVVWKNLLALELIHVGADGRVQITLEKLRVSSPVPSKVLRQAHLQELQIAQEKLENTPMGQRNFSSLTFAMNAKKMPEAANLIRKFLQQMESTFERGAVDQVFQLGIQLYPLSILETDA
jgi:uncharacterized protein (TIGR02147 family)